MITLTDHQRAVLAHIVVDPDEWVANAETELGTLQAKNAIVTKVRKWESLYQNAIAEQGESYMTRAERES